MPDSPAPKSSGSLKGFLTGQTAGLPNWAWALVVVAGVAAAYFLPKLLGSGSSSSATPTTGTDTSGIGLAVDPTTGLPYAVEGLVPSGGTAGGGAQGPQGPTGPAGSNAQPFKEFSQGTLIYKDGSGKWWYELPGQTPKLLQGGTGAYLPDNAIINQGGEGRWWADIGGTGYALTPTLGGSVGTIPSGSFITIPAWPSSQMTLGSLASRYAISVDKLKQLNPGISNTLKSGEKVKIS